MAQLKKMTTHNRGRTLHMTTAFRTAKISEFRAPAPKLLFGERLKAITELEDSIAKHGLMTPLKVTRSAGKLIVMDGRKRLCALRRMWFKNTLPRGLINIPYVLTHEPAAHVLSAQEQYSEMASLQNGGKTPQEITVALCINLPRLHALQSIDRLSPRLKTAFMSQIISLDQAEAFAALPWPEAQDSLLLSVGPFASARDITKAIAERLRHDTGRKTQTAAENVITMPVPPLAGLMLCKDEVTARLAA